MKDEKSNIVEYYFDPKDTENMVMRSFRVRSTEFVGGNTLDEIYNNYKALAKKGKLPSSDSETE